MFNRQSVLLEILRQAGRPVEKLELVKWAFLVRHESESEGGSSFYDFVPYHHGPHSFALAREMESLTAVGHVRETESNWELGEIAADPSKLPKAIVQDIKGKIGNLSKKPVNELSDYVYDKYPAFTVNSQRQMPAPRPTARPQVYTAGYEGLQIDKFLNRLVQNGIEQLLDVRSNPIARRFGFHKSTLERLCGALNIRYSHIPELGIKSEERRSLQTTADYMTLFDRYETATLVDQRLIVERTASMVAERPSVLVCMEADPCFCHRSRLARDVAHLTSLPVVHLEHDL